MPCGVVAVVSSMYCHHGILRAHTCAEKYFSCLETCTKVIYNFHFVPTTECLKYLPSRHAKCRDICSGMLSVNLDTGHPSRISTLGS